MARALLEDGSLALRAQAAVWSAVEAWVPRIPPAEPDAARVRAWIEVEHGPPAFAPPAAPPAVLLCSVAGWPMPGGELLLLEPEGRVSATVDPAAGRARVRLRETGVPPEALRVEIFAALTVAAALLLGRLDRTLVHAAAVAAPDGRAWLLVGGTFSGKTTTCVNLIRAGWDYLSDDHVVLRGGPGGPWIEGWPRPFNLDHGYAAGDSRGVRGRVDPREFGPGHWRRAAPLGGLLFPRVQAELATELQPVGTADALSALLQQSPWLLADRGTAPAVLGLLQQTAQLPAFRLRLGGDCYHDHARLQRVLGPALSPGA